MFIKCVPSQCAMILYAALVLGVSIVASGSAVGVGDDTSYPLPCILNNGCVCNHSMPYDNPQDDQTYGTCVNCTEGYAGATCANREVPCLNLGVQLPNGSCSCSLPWVGADCTDRVCMNSKGGVGPDKVVPPSDTTNFCTDCLPGYDGISCDMCLSDSVCEEKLGAGSVCSHNVKPVTSDKSFICDVTNKMFLGPLGRGRDVGGTVKYDCHSPSQFAEGATDGECTVAFYRIEPDNSYIDPFFFCTGFECGVSESVSVVQQDDTTDGGSSRSSAFTFFKGAGQVLLLALCFMVGIARYIPGPDNVRRFGTKALMVSLVLVLIGYIFCVLILMSARPTETIRSTIFKCNQAACTCGKDPINDSYVPFCKGSAFGDYILPTITHENILTCNSDTLACTFQPKDISTEIALQCRSSECVPKNETGKIPTGSGATTDAKIHGDHETTWILIFLLGVSVVFGWALHIYTVCRRSRVAKEEFINKYVTHSSASSNQSADGDDDEGVYAGRGQLEHSLQERPPATTSSPTRQIGGRDIVDLADHTGTSSGAYEEEEEFSDDDDDVRRPLNQQPAPSATRVVSSTSRSTSESGGGGVDMVSTGVRCTLTASNIHYKVSSNGCCTEPNKHILKGIDLEFESGDVVALMGSSGAGKTTLLDILAARQKSGFLTGSMGINGCEVLSSNQLHRYRNLVGYVSQEDTLLPSLTVTETIRYAARLKLPSAFSSETITEIVEALIDSLRLRRCANTIIGDGGTTSRGVSGGEKRRVSVAVELVGNPRILFLDEPTSGLDASSALHVVETMSMLAKTSPLRKYAPAYFAFHPIVIASIHQPSKQIFSKFNKIAFLAEGRLLYAGPVHLAHVTLLDRVDSTIRSIVASQDIENPAEMLLAIDDALTSEQRTMLAGFARGIQGPHLVGVHTDTSSNVTPSTQTPTSEGGSEGGYPTGVRASEVMGADGRPGSEHDVMLPTTSRTNSTSLTPSGSPATGSSEVGGADVLLAAEGARRYYANIYQQTNLLVRRATASLMGSYYLIAAHSIVAFFMGTLMCSLYSEEPLDLPGSLNRAGSITFLLLVQSFISLSALEQLMTERKLFVTERENGCYSTLPYLMSKIVVDFVPLRIVPAILVSSIIYFPMGLRTDFGTYFMWFMFIVTLFTLVMTLLIVCIGVVSNSFGAAALLSAVLILWNFVFGGLLVQADTIPSMFQPFRRISPFYLAFETLLVNELDGQMCSFAPVDAAGRPSSTVIPLYCTQYLYNLGLHPENFSNDVIALILEAIVLALVAYMLLMTVSVRR